MENGNLQIFAYQYECDFDCFIRLFFSSNLIAPPTEGMQLEKMRFSTCKLLNISQCAETEDSPSFVVTVYNPLSRPVTQYVRFPVTGKHYTVTDPNGIVFISITIKTTLQINSIYFIKTISTGAELESQMVPVPEQVQSIPGSMSGAAVELVFKATDLPPLGFRSYYVRDTSKYTQANQLKHVEKRSVHNGVSIFLKSINRKSQF